MGAASNEAIVHLFAGGIGGTVGAIATCPLEVVKTRLQSSSNNFHASFSSSSTFMGTNSFLPYPQQRAAFSTCSSCSTSTHFFTVHPGDVRPKRMGLLQCIRHIVQNEGPASLFKGLGPNLVGVAPSRAIYFYAYSRSKSTFNAFFTPDSSAVHLCSAATAGFVSCTLTNPIWFVKTRLQLDNHVTGKHMTSWQCIKLIFQQKGFMGFYKGITASYYGISETVVHFVIYEAIKARIHEMRFSRATKNNGVYVKTPTDFFEFMLAAAASKTIASTLAYPHEVARTRLREEGTKYRGFWQTLSVVLREEGVKGIYRGLSTQLIRQIPNTAIMMCTYEVTVHLLSNHHDTLSIAINNYADDIDEPKRQQKDRNRPEN